VKKKRKSGIYKIINLKNGRFYIGSAADVFGRRKQHFWYLKKNIHQNQFLQNDFNKCGLENFRFVLLEETTKSKQKRKASRIPDICVLMK